MNGRPRGDDGPARTRRTDAKPEAEAQTPPPLETVAVGCETRPDRLTVYPADCRDERRRTTWLSANASAFVDLGEYR